MTTTDLLIIDDDTDLTYLITQILEPYQIAIASTTSLGAAELFLLSSKVRHILLDHHVPDGTALDFIGKIHSIDPTIRIMVTTNSNSRLFQDQAMAKGAAAFLPKPFSYQQVIELGLMAGGVKRVNGHSEISE